MNRSSTDQGQRVDDPVTVTGDAADLGEPDAARLKARMAEAGTGDDGKLAAAERAAERDATAVAPDHRENDAGQ